MAQKGVKVVAQNRKARHDYFVEETYEAGLELRGTEVKSIQMCIRDRPDGGRNGGFRRAVQALGSDEPGEL